MSLSVNDKINLAERLLPHVDIDGGQGRTADDLAERAAIAGAAAILVILLGVGLACVISGRALL